MTFGHSHHWICSDGHWSCDLWLGTGSRWSFTNTHPNVVLIRPLLFFGLLPMTCLPLLCLELIFGLVILLCHSGLCSILPIHVFVFFPCSLPMKSSSNCLHLFPSLSYWSRRGLRRTMALSYMANIKLLSAQ